MNMGPNKEKMEQEEEYKKAISILNELENFCLDDSLIEEVRFVFSFPEMNMCKGTIRSDKIDSSQL
jgi:hypothetical protein